MQKDLFHLQIILLAYPNRLQMFRLYDIVSYFNSFLLQIEINHSNLAMYCEAQAYYTLYRQLLTKIQTELNA